MRWLNLSHDLKCIFEFPVPRRDCRREGKCMGNQGGDEEKMKRHVVIIGKRKEEKGKAIGSILVLTKHHT